MAVPRPSSKHKNSTSSNRSIQNGSIIEIEPFCTPGYTKESHNYTKWCMNACLPFPILELSLIGRASRGKMNPTTNKHRYQIQILGHLPESWSDWFDNLSLTPHPDGVTVITGTFSDQAALFGFLWRIRDLGLPLLSVNPLNKETQNE